MKRINYILFLTGIILVSCTKDENNDCVDESKVNVNSPCTFEYSPVCGCNNITYSNQCDAENHGVTSWTNGPCK